MGLMHRRKPKNATPVPPENGDVRKFRFVPRTAPRAAQERLTQDALTLDETDKGTASIRALTSPLSPEMTVGLRTMGRGGPAGRARR